MEWPGLLISGEEEASPTMVTMATRAVSLKHAWEPQTSPLGKRLPFPWVEGSLSVWGPETQAIQVPHCLTLGYVEVQRDSSPRREVSVTSLGWVVSVPSREESVYGFVSLVLGNMGPDAF